MNIEWDRYQNPRPILKLIEGSVSDRKLRLFACACARANPLVVNNPACLSALLAAEDMADSIWNESEMKAHRKNVWAEFDIHKKGGHRPNTEYHLLSASDSLWKDAFAAAYYGSFDATFAPEVASNEGVLVEETQFQCQILRDICEPFDASRFRAPSATLANFAQFIYCNHRFDLMSQLGEMIEQESLGAELASHCFGSPHHFKGCWVVDWLLGKA